MKGIARFSGNRPVDPLSVYDDTFQGSSLASKWLVYKPAALAAAVVGSGYLLLTINGGGAGATNSFWFDGNDGIQIYQTISGNWTVECYVVARNGANSGAAPVAGFNVACVAAHDPANPPYNYVHNGPASNNTAGLQNEDKSTNNSLSTFDYVAEPTGGQWVQMTRLGQVFSTAYKVNASDPWIPRTTYNRNVLLPPIPNTVRLGPVVYSSVGASNVSGQFSYFTVRTPA